MNHALRQRLDDTGAAWMPYGPGEFGVETPASFDVYEAEYAAMRQRVAVMCWPQRALLRLVGGDVKDYLNRMLTQDIAKLTGGASVRSFQLTDKGRIRADLIVHHGDLDTWLDLDCFDLAAVRELLEARLFAEDVTITDITAERACFALYGPASLSALEQLVADGRLDLLHETGLPTHAGKHVVLTLSTTPAVKVSAYRDDVGEVMGVRLWCPAEHAAMLWQALMQTVGYEAGVEKNAAFAAQRRQSLRGRPVGWLAFNTVRVEQRQPWFHIDFASDSLPGETGLLEQTCSFTKGCYVGQEVVARMKNLGHPKQMICAMHFAGDRQPVAGEQVYAGDSDKPVGGITSSTPSPLRGHAAVALGMMRWGFHEPGTRIRAQAEGKWVEGEVAGG